MSEHAAVEQPWAAAYERALQPGFAEAAIPDGYVKHVVNRKACAETFRAEIAAGYATAALRIPWASVRTPDEPEKQLAFCIGYLARFQEAKA